MAWKMPTLADTRGNGAAQCVCGRKTTTDMIRDLRGMEPATRAAMGLPELPCDACCERVFAGGVSRVAFYEAIGAPVEVVEIIAAKVAATAS